MAVVLLVTQRVVEQECSLEPETKCAASKLYELQSPILGQAHIPHPRGWGGTRPP